MTIIREPMCPALAPKWIRERFSRRDGTHADLQFESGRATVTGLDSVVLFVMPVLVEVDESRRHHQAAGIDHTSGRERRARDRRDRGAAGAYMPDCVQARFRIDHPSVVDGDVKLLGAGGKRHGQEKKQRPHWNS
jgi:hypothetical protein